MAKKKTYVTIQAYHTMTFMVPGFGGVTVHGRLTTDDEDIQDVIEGSATFKRGHIALEKSKGEVVDNLAQVTPVPRPPNVNVQGSAATAIKVDGDDVIPAEPGASYAAYKLEAMKVAELRGICMRQRIDFKGLKNAEMVRSILKGERVEIK